MTTTKIPQLAPLTTALDGSEEFEIARNSVSRRLTSINLFKAVGILPGLSGSGNPTPPSGFRIPLYGVSDGQPYSCTLDQAISVTTGTVPAGGTTGQVLTKSSDADYDTTWASNANGDVFGPASSTDNAIARFDLATGKIIQNSGVVVDDSNNMTGVGTLASGAHAVTSSSASAFVVGANGATNPALTVDASASSVATGLNIAGAAAGSRALLSVLSSGTNEGLSIDAKGSGTVRFGATSTGAIEFSRNAVPTASDGASLGTASLNWSDAFLASGAVINFANGDVTVTHSSDILTFSGASTGYRFENPIVADLVGNAVQYMLHDPTILGTVGTSPGNVQNTKYIQGFTPSRQTNGPVGEPIYIDNVWSVGVNWMQGQRPNTSYGGFGYQMESRFYNTAGAPAYFGGEWNWEFIDKAGNTRRFMAMAFPEEAAQAAQLNFNISFARIQFHNYEGTNKIDFRLNTGVVDVRDSIYLKFAVNNTPIMAQNNGSSSAYLNLPFINSSNELKVSQPTLFQVSRNSSPTIVPAAVQIQLLTANANDYIWYGSMPAVTGAATAHRWDGSTTTGWSTLLFNANTATATAHATHAIQTGGASAGDPRVLFTIDGVQDWTAGVDNSDSDKFKISRSSALGTNDCLSIDTSGNTAIASAGSNALAVGASGATNPVLNVDASASSVATGLSVTGAAAGSRAGLAVISSGTDEGLNIDAKGIGSIRLGATSTGAIEFSRNAVPTASDGSALGTTLLHWSDMFLASGGVLNWNNGTFTLTQAAAVLSASGTVRALELGATGDVGGAASTNSLTNVSDVTANSSGVGTIKFKGTTSRDTAGFIKIYIGTTPYYVPVFTAISG